MTEYTNSAGVPLRADGTLFPDDPSHWSDEEQEYLQSYVFGVEKHAEIEEQEVAVTAVTDVGGDAAPDDVVNTGVSAWHVIEAGKPSASLGESACSAVPGGPGWSGLDGSQAPNRIQWRLRYTNALGLDVVLACFELKWEYGARYDGGGAFIPTCWLHVPQCEVLWGYSLDVTLYAHQPSNAGTDAAPVARLPITISGAVTTPFWTDDVRWDYTLFGDGHYE
jgi:hypothetical protein